MPPRTRFRTNLLTYARAIPFEAYVWTGALVALACTDPTAPGVLDLCLFKHLGLSFCPGCGLGHAIVYLFQGAWLLSWEAHPLGGVAVLVLGHRIVTLLRSARPRAASHSVT